MSWGWVSVIYMSHLLLETCCSETNRKYFAARYHDQGFEKEMNRECQQIGKTVRKPKNDEKRSMYFNPLLDPGCRPPLM